MPTTSEGVYAEKPLTKPAMEKLHEEAAKADVDYKARLVMMADTSKAIAALIMEKDVTVGEAQRILDDVLAELGNKIRDKKLSEI
jgi:hypothetical protein